MFWENFLSLYYVVVNSLFTYLLIYNWSLSFILLVSIVFFQVIITLIIRALYYKLGKNLPPIFFFLRFLWLYLDICGSIKIWLKYYFWKNTVWFLIGIVLNLKNAFSMLVNLIVLIITIQFCLITIINVLYIKLHNSVIYIRSKDNIKFNLVSHTL